MHHSVQLSLVVGILFAASCRSNPNTVVDESTQARLHNRQKLLTLKIGMTKAEVLAHMEERTWLSTMGDINNPYRTEAATGKNGKTVEVIFYLTDLKRRDNAITDDELTPLVFEDDRLKGWGWTSVGQSVTKYEFRSR